MLYMMQVWLSLVTYTLSNFLGEKLAKALMGNGGIIYVPIYSNYDIWKIVS